MNAALLLPAALAALAALLLPLLIHLARRSEQRPTDFAALRWLRQKPKPRHRIRFDEWPLLILRLLLLALLAVWLARPVLFGSASEAPWVAVMPGIDAVQARAAVDDKKARLHWLAPGFPALDQPPPAAGSLPFASLLRQLDSELPAAVKLSVFVPERLQGADAQRPRLSRVVEWKVLPGAMPAPKPLATPAPALIVRYAEDHKEGLRYLRAATAAWQPNTTTTAFAAAPVAQTLPAETRNLVWLASNLRNLFATPSPAPARVAARDYAPITGAASYAQPPRDLQPWLALLIAAMLLVERWLATRRSRGSSP
jgi:hypothetical protein